MNLDKLYKIEIFKDNTWKVYFTDSFKVFTEANADDRIAELERGVEELKDREKFSRVTAPDWKFRKRPLTKAEKDEIQDTINKHDNKLTAQEWQPGEVIIK